MGMACIEPVYDNVYDMFMTCVGRVYDMCIACVQHVCHMYVTCIWYVYLAPV